MKKPLNQIPKQKTVEAIGLSPEILRVSEPYLLPCLWLCYSVCRSKAFAPLGI